MLESNKFNFPLITIKYSYLIKYYRVYRHNSMTKIIILNLFNYINFFLKLYKKVRYQSLISVFRQKKKNMIENFFKHKIYTHIWDFGANEISFNTYFNFHDNNSLLSIFYFLKHCNVFLNLFPIFFIFRKIKKLNKYNLNYIEEMFILKYIQNSNFLKRILINKIVIEYTNMLKSKKNCYQKNFKDRKKFDNSIHKLRYYIDKGQFISLIDNSNFFKFLEINNLIEEDNKNIMFKFIATKYDSLNWKNVLAVALLKFRVLLLKGMDIEKFLYFYESIILKVIVLSLNKNKKTFLTELVRPLFVLKKIYVFNQLFKQNVITFKVIFFKVIIKNYISFKPLFKLLIIFNILIVFIKFSIQQSYNRIHLIINIFCSELINLFKKLNVKRQLKKIYNLLLKHCNLLRYYNTLSIEGMIFLLIFDNNTNLFCLFIQFILFDYMKYNSNIRKNYDLNDNHDIYYIKFLFINQYKNLKLMILLNELLQKIVSFSKCYIFYKNFTLKNRNHYTILSFQYFLDRNHMVKESIIMRINYGSFVMPKYREYFWFNLLKDCLRSKHINKNILSMVFIKSIENKFLKNKKFILIFFKVYLNLHNDMELLDTIDKYISGCPSKFIDLESFLLILHLFGKTMGKKKILNSILNIIFGILEEKKQCLLKIKTLCFSLAVMFKFGMVKECREILKYFLYNESIKNKLSVLNMLRYFEIIYGSEETFRDYINLKSKIIC